MYVQSNTLLLADIFENFWNMCIEIYKLDPARFFYCTSIIMAIDLLADTDILLMVKRVIRGGICHATHRDAKANNK